MDIFMDKLAQRTTAQEIIRANTAADMEELNKLKNQIEGYHECLFKLQKLIEDGSERLSDMQDKDFEAGRLARESLEQVKSLQQLAESLGQSQKKIADRIEVAEKSLTRGLESLSGDLKEKLEHLDGVTQEQLTEALSALEENVHKECVKVYRNVQAVVTEESGKLDEKLTEVNAKTSSFGKKLGLVLGLSVAAAVFSLAGVVFQILSQAGVLPF